MLSSPKSTVSLSNGVQIPCLGFGSWHAPENQTLEDAVLTALELGYRHIDTAAVYSNEHGIGNALKASGLPRSEIFLTDKLWNTERNYDAALRSFDRSLELLGTDYIDLYMIHWPASRGESAVWQSANAGTWRALERLCREKRVRAIGVSNFLPHHLIPLLCRSEIAPMVNTIEFHPGYPQAETVMQSKKLGMHILGWAPLGRGTLLESPVLSEIGSLHGKTPAQVCLRWSLQHGVLPIARSLSRQHLKENTEIFDFSLSADEMHRIDAMPLSGFSGLHPDYVSY